MSTTMQDTTARAIWAGLDAAKDSFDAAVYLAVEPGQTIEPTDVPVRTFPRTHRGVEQFVRWADSLVAHCDTQHGPFVIRVAMEATGTYSLELAAWLVAVRPTLAPAIVNPARVRAFGRSLGVRNKTDVTDARTIARFGAERKPRPYEPPSDQLRQLRALSRERDTVVSILVAQRLHSSDPSPCAVVVSEQKRLIRNLEQSIARLEAAMTDLIEQHPPLRRDVELLQTIPGVGRITAIVILAELGDLRRFERSRQLGAFAGMSPQRHESGSSVRRQTHLCKQGNRRVRSALYMAAMAAIRSDNSLAQFYHHLVEQGKSNMAALGAVMRKQIVLARAILISGQPYQHDFIPVHERSKTCE